MSKIESNILLSSKIHPNGKICNNWLRLLKKFHYSNHNYHNSLIINNESLSLLSIIPKFN